MYPSHMGLFGFLLPGRMPLPVAWIIAGVAVPLLLILLARAAAGTAWDVPLFFGLLLGALIGAVGIAWAKQRRPWLWGLMALVAFGLTAVQIGGPLIQPVTVVAVVALAQSASRYAAVPVPAGADFADGSDGDSDDNPLEDGEAEESAAPAASPQARWEPPPREGAGQTQQQPARKPFRPHRRSRRWS